MKVGIVTLYGLDNYGNRLQNYALQEILNQLGYETYSLINYVYLNEKKLLLLRAIKNFLKAKQKKININRRNAFIEFNKNIRFYKKIITAYSNLDFFDILIVGSDQVWNPFTGGIRDVDMLNLKGNFKKVSYAASFGVHEIDEKSKEKLKKYLPTFYDISVREEQGKTIILEAIARQDVKVVLDPTMLLSARKWENVMKKPLALKSKKYILNYFLGELSEEKNQLIQKFAKKNDCEIITILDKKSPFYETGPSEFLYLEKNAYMIFTDSFHSCVFAILFHVPFLIFEREQKLVKKMNSRLDTLLNTFQLTDYKFQNELEIVRKEFNVKKMEQILEKERKSSIQFLKNISIEVNDYER